ncbi:hypothetical protein [Nocardioides sp.]|uniref:hypothetical protein n=1 Tax=Nocardioides sp. TaxID=35761 RepID=UPI003514309E
MIAELTTQIGTLKEIDFEAKAHIGTASLGAGDVAEQLTYHHARAYGVVVDTLKEMIGDLVAFRDSVREARELVRRSDEAAAAEMTQLMSTTESLDLGARAQAESQYAHRDTVAVDDERFDRADDEPVVTPGPPASGTDEGAVR